MKNDNKLFSKIAELVAEQSTCCRLKVGAILVKDNRIISMGFNGVASNQTHCEDYFYALFNKQYKFMFKSYEEFLSSDIFYNLHGEFSNKNELHAEQNAIAYAAKSGISTEDSSIYVTYSPCIHCAKIIASCGIKKVFFNNLYDRSQDGILFLKNNNIECISI